MKFSYEWIQELSGVKLSVADGATQLQRAFEDIEVAESEGGTPILDIDVLPNRPDALSHIGIARELAALTGSVWHEVGEQVATAERNDIEVRIEDAQACPRYTGLIVRGVAVGPSPDWMVKRLTALGLKSINNVVDVANYVMLETGQPLHAFDLHKLNDGITVRWAKKGESLRALDEARTPYTLDPTVLVIADRQGPVAVAGIKGGEGTGVTEQTHDIFLESAVFSAPAIRRGSSALGLRTDASVRFSYGVPPELTTRALARAARLLADVAGGTADRVAVDAYPQAQHRPQLVLNADYARSLLGADVSDGDIFKVLTNLGFEVSGSGTALQVAVPPWRLDVSRQEDLVEEVGRVFGYENVPSVPPVVHAFDERGWLKEDEDVAWDEASFIRERYAIGRLLAGDGYTETFSYSFLSDELVEALGLEGLPELAVPQSNQFRWLRTSLVPRLLLQARDNLRFAKGVNLFETGHVFFRMANGKEPARLALVRAAAGGTTADDVFYELKGSLDHLIAQLGITDAYVDDAEPFSADAAVLATTAAGRRAALKDGTGATLGFFGQVDPAMAAKLKLKGSAAIAELDLRALITHTREEREFEPLPRYPAVERDISMLVANDVKVARVLEAIHAADTSGLVRDVDVLDIFVPTGKERLAPEGSRHDYGKSIAVRIVFRSDERTLTDEEVTVAEDAIKRALADRVNAQIR